MKGNSSYLKPSLFLSLVLLSLISCQEFEPAKKEKAEGGKNPFTVDNFQKAITNLNATNTNGRTEVFCSDCLPPSTTHNYVQFNPQNEDQVIRLHNIGYDLYETPLDENVAVSYVIPDADFVPLFTLVPSNYGLPSDVPHQVIGQVVLFDEDAGDNNDPEEPIEDPWEPEPPCPSCCINPYLCPRMETDPEEKNPMKKLTRSLMKAGVDMHALTDELFRASGNEAELDEIKKPGGRTQSTRYFPAGFIRVEDTSVGRIVPVKNVLVKSRRWFKIGATFTREDGYFGINKGYRKQAKIIIEFQNSRASFRGISGLLKLWEYVFPLETTAGDFERGALQNVEHVFRNPGSAIDRSLTWVAAHGMNTLFEGDQNNNARGILPPSNQLRVWVSNAITQSASAPMLRAVANSSQLVTTIQYLFPGVGSAAAKIIRAFAPDITLRVQDGGNNLRSADNIINTFYHEYAHATHYRQVGNGYWAAYIATIVGNGGYGSKTSSDAGRIAVAEAWGFYVGNTLTAQKYNSVGSAPAMLIARANIDGLENQVPGDNSWQQWIPFGLYHDMTDIGEPPFTTVIDNANLYNMQQIFRGLQPNVTSVQGFRQEILNRNNNLQVTAVNQLVTSYRY